MENRNIVMILLAVIAILAIVLGVIFFEMAKEESNLAISDKEINVGDSVVVVLTDSHGTPIANETVSIKLTDNDGTIIDKDITTNSKGKAKFKMKEKGKYSVECKFDGNSQYSSASIVDNVKVEKATTQLVSQEQTSTATHTSKYAPNGGIYPEYGPEVDSYGHTREYAIEHDMHYVEMTLADGRTVGGYTAIDSNTGYYHT